MDVQVKLWLKEGHTWEFCCDENDRVLIGLLSALPGAHLGEGLPQEGLIQICSRTGERLFVSRSSLLSIAIEPMTLTWPSLAPDADVGRSCEEFVAPLKRGRLFFRGLGQRGRLGNQLFQIAATIGIAQANNLQPVFPQWRYEQEFEGQLPRASISDEILPSYHEENFVYAPIKFTSSHTIDGYFQSEKYFHDVRAAIVSQFRPSKQNKLEVDRLFRHYRCPDCAMHVRRGDYSNNNLYYDLCSSFYYERALSKFGTSARILVLSDDPEWCRTRFRDERLVFAERSSDVIDLFLFSRPPANIIANSSYSWWGAWLNSNIDPVVFAPERWFAGEFADTTQPFRSFPHYRGFHETRDLLPTKWTKLKCE
jgi:hypothetical protein